LLAPRPSDKPDGDYGAYLTYPEMQAKIAGWARTHPDLVQVSSLGKTFEGRDIPLVRLSAVPATAPDSVPEVLLLSGIHPREQQPQIGIAALVDEFLAGYKTDAVLTKLLQERVVWIVPVFNVDGKVYDMQHGNGRTRGRTGARTGTQTRTARRSVSISIVTGVSGGAAVTPSTPPGTPRLWTVNLISTRDPRR
jgi:carboxypeptidase T